MIGTFKKLLEAWEKEKENPEIQNIPDQLPTEIIEYINELDDVTIDIESLKGKMMQKEKQYTLIMFEQFQKLRLHKIILNELEGKPIDAIALTPEEQNLHAQFRQLLLGFKYNISSSKVPQKSITERTSTISSNKTFPQRKDLIIVRFTQDLPAIMGVDMKAYGPFSEEDVASLPRENALNLIRRGVAKLVEKEP